jgi:signal transduction histidine kinase
MRSLAQAGFTGWPLAATLAMLLAGERLRAGRRRLALNRGLHELRRPLQAMILATPAARLRDPAPSALEMALAALASLDRELNGDPGSSSDSAPIGCGDLAAGCVRRWGGRAAISGADIELRWLAPGATVRGDGNAISQALDNLIVNAIDHGGPRIVVEGRVRDQRLLIAVGDDGCDRRSEARRGSPREVIARLTGDRQRGHGLEVVRRVAADHGGRFALSRSPTGSLALLELPLAAPQAADAA